LPFSRRISGEAPRRDHQPWPAIVAVVSITFMLMSPVALHAKDDAMLKAADIAIGQLAGYLGDLSAVQSLPPEERKGWLQQQALERIQKKAAEQAQAAILAAAKKHAAACIRAKAFQDIAAPAARQAFAMGQQVDWTVLHAQSAAAAAEKINAMNTALTSAKVTWATARSFYTQGAMAGFRTLSGEVSDLFAKAYIPGYAWIKLASKIVVAGGNYIMETVREDASARAISLIFDKPLDALGDHIQRTSASELAATVTREWTDMNINSLIRYPGSNSESGEAAMVQRVTNSILQIKEEFDRREALQKRFEDDIAAIADPLLQEARASGAELAAAANAAMLAAEPYVRIIEAVFPKAAELDAEYDATEAQETYTAFTTAYSLEPDPRYTPIDRPTYLGPLQTFLGQFMAPPPANFNLVTFSEAQQSLPYPSHFQRPLVNIVELDLSAFEAQWAALWSAAVAEGSAMEWVEACNEAIRGLQEEHERAYGLYYETLAGLMAAEEADLWADYPFHTVMAATSEWLAEWTQRVASEDPLSVNFAAGQARDLMRRDKARAEEIQQGYRTAAQTLKNSLDSIVSRYMGLIPASWRYVYRAEGLDPHVQYTFGHPLLFGVQVEPLVIHEIHPFLLQQTGIDFNQADYELGKILSNTAWARDEYDLKRSLEAALGLLEEIFAPYRHPAESLASPNWRLPAEQWEISQFLDQLDAAAADSARTLDWIDSRQGLLSAEGRDALASLAAVMAAVDLRALRDELKARLPAARETVNQRMAPYWENLANYGMPPAAMYEAYCADLASTLQTIQVWANGARAGISPELATATEELLALQAAYVAKIMEIRQAQDAYRTSNHIPAPRFPTTRTEVRTRVGETLLAAPVKIAGATGTYSSPNLPAGVAVSPDSGEFTGVPGGGGFYEVVLNFTEAGGLTTGTVVTFRIADPALAFSGVFFPDALPTAAIDWVEVPWLGYLHEAQYPWIFHGALGWVFPVGNVTGGSWLWQYAVPASGGWMYASAGLHPYFYSHAVESWVYHLPGTESPGYFHLLGTGEWLVVP
jgi:hypothetical protein